MRKGKRLSPEKVRICSAKGLRAVPAFNPQVPHGSGHREWLLVPVSCPGEGSGLEPPQRGSSFVPQVSSGLAAGPVSSAVSECSSSVNILILSPPPYSVNKAKKSNHLSYSSFLTSSCSLALPGRSDSPLHSDISASRLPFLSGLFSDYTLVQITKGEIGLPFFCVS